MPSKKTAVFEAIFRERWNPDSRILDNPMVTLEEVSQAIELYNRDLPPSVPQSARLSSRNCANFFKDFTRRRRSANENWPRYVLGQGYTARQVTTEGKCFVFVPLPEGQAEPFPVQAIRGPTPATPHRDIESASMPLASRRLGRSDEPWLTQVIVRLRVIETHLALFSSRRFVQIDHLQMSVGLRGAEIDALFLGHESVNGGSLREIIISCEAKRIVEDFSGDQIVQQVKSLFGLPSITQDLIVPMGVKVIGRSEIHVIEFEAITRAVSQSLENLAIASDAVYKLHPDVPGIG